MSRNHNFAETAGNVRPLPLQLQKERRRFGDTSSSRSHVAYRLCTFSCSSEVGSNCALAS